MFFDEIKDIEKTVNGLRDDLLKIRDGVDGHYDQLDDIAAHIIALEAILVEVLKKSDVDSEAVKAWIVEATKSSTGDDEGSVKAKIIAESLIKGEALPKN